MDNLKTHFIPWLRYLWHRFDSDGCMRSSAALTYMSLFALVPLITVMFVILSAIPDLQGTDEKLQSLLFEYLFPGGDVDGDALSTARNQVSNALTTFSSQAKSLGGPGVAVLIITAVLMLRNVEATFNVIWRAPKNRSPISSFLLYWAVLSLGPILIGLALGAGTYNSLAGVLDNIGVDSKIREGFLQFAPFVSSATAFSLLYAAVPNCRVNIRHAFIGGIVTALAFNLARWSFGKLIAKTSYTAIYGAFAAFPLLLLWIYLSWNIVLGGSVLVHSLSSYRHDASSRVPKLIKALAVLEVLWQHYQRGETVSEFNLLAAANAEQAGIGSDTWHVMRERFMEKRLIRVDDRGECMLARDLRQVNLWQLKEWISGELPLEEMALKSELSWQQNAQAIIESQRRSQRELMQVSLAELFEK